MTTKSQTTIPLGGVYTTLGELIAEHMICDGIPDDYELVVKRNRRRVSNEMPLVVKKPKAITGKPNVEKTVERLLEAFEARLKGTDLYGQCVLLLCGPSPTGIKTKSGGVDGHFTIRRLVAHSAQLKLDAELKSFVAKQMPRVEKQIDGLHALPNSQPRAVVRSYVAVLLKRFGKDVFRAGVGRLA